MSVYTTEITSDTLPSDNPIHQRLLKAYVVAKDYVNGDLLELGCGEGRGVDLLNDRVNSYTAIDKIQHVVDTLSENCPDGDFQQGYFPPCPFESDRFDSIISFQVIEHLEDDHQFVKEIYRMLKPGGLALLSTPNIKMTLTRNPWHTREYTSEQLKSICELYFSQVSMMGIGGNQKVMEYYEKNKISVQKITRFDILNLQYRLPASVLRIPYDLMNRLNRSKLKRDADDLVASITDQDYLLREELQDNLDLFVILKK